MASAQPSDPVAVRQWIVAVGLVLHAEESARRGSSIDLATAIVMADTAAEAAIGILSRRAPGDPANDSRGEYLKRAARVARMPADVVTELRDVHKIRNGVVHQGAEASAHDSLRAVMAARTLLDSYVPRVLKRSRALGYGKGIASAVAALLGDHPIAPALAAAERLAAADPRGSLEQISTARALIEQFTRPKLPSRTHYMHYRAPSSREAGVIAPAFDRIARKFEQLERADRDTVDWIVPLALGLSPAAYAQLLEPLPHTWTNPEGDTTHQWPDEANPTTEQAQRSLERMAYLAFRLWLTDLLAYPEIASGQD